MSGPLDLVKRWREEAMLYRRRGLEAEARLAGSYADELEAYWRDHYPMELLTLRRAAREIGLSYDRMQKLVAKGTIPNAGRKHRPRVRRCNLLNGTRSRAPELENGSASGPDLAGDELRERWRDHQRQA